MYASCSSVTVNRAPSWSCACLAEEVTQLTARGRQVQRPRGQRGGEEVDRGQIVQDPKEGCEGSAFTQNETGATEGSV